MFDQPRGVLARLMLFAMAALAILSLTPGIAVAADRVASAEQPRDEGPHKKSEPIVINISDVTVPEFRQLCPANVIKENKCKGDANLTINPDGSWNFTGSFPWSEQGSHMDFVMGVKDSKETLILFTASANSTVNGYVWNKQGNNRTIKDNFSAFEEGFHWYWKARVQLVYDHTQSGGGPSLGDILGDVGKALGVAATVAAAVL